jgi:WD40 repeat protein
MFADSVDVPRTLEFTRNGRVLLIGDDAGKISPWDIGESRRIGTVKAHTGGVHDLAVSMEGTLLSSAGAHGEVSLWDMGAVCSTSAGGAEPLRRFVPKRAVTQRIAFSSRNLLLAIGTSKTPQV